MIDVQRPPLSISNDQPSPRPKCHLLWHCLSNFFLLRNCQKFSVQEGIFYFFGGGTLQKGFLGPRAQPTPRQRSQNAVFNDHPLPPKSHSLQAQPQALAGPPRPSWERGMALHSTASCTGCGGLAPHPGASRMGPCSCHRACSAGRGMGAPLFGPCCN